MVNRFESFPSQEEKEERKEILKEMKEVAYSEQPTPKEDWDLVWVLSGDNLSLNEVPEKGKRNMTRDRVETALGVVRKVTALRTAKKLEDVTSQDIVDNGPIIYFNGVEAQNTVLKEEISSNWDFPTDKVIISGSQAIEHTGDQFDEIPKELLDGKRKVVIVSSTYHLPRLKRYVEKHSDKMDPDKVVLYSSEPKDTPFRKTIGEIRKIPRYKKRGIFSKEKKEQ